MTHQPGVYMPLRALFSSEYMYCLYTGKRKKSKTYIPFYVMQAVVADYISRTNH